MRMSQMLIEAALLLVVGLAVAVYANWDAKQPLKISRQYNQVLIDRQKAKENDPQSATGTQDVSTPKGDGTDATENGARETRDPATTEPASTETNDAPTSSTPSTVSTPTEPKRIDGFLVAGLREVLDAVQMSAEVPELFLILDARSWDHYIEGHIPGAISMSFYSVDVDQVEALRDRLEANPTVYIYCNGGDCTDSTGLAHELLGHCSDLGIPLDADFVRVYEEGMNEFKKLHPDLVVTGESPR